MTKKADESRPPEERLAYWLEQGRRLAQFGEADSAAFAERLTEETLQVRDRAGLLVPLKANLAQHEFERTRRQHNIILKARQMGMTSWVAGRFFLKTILTEGTTTVQVAQTREAAEAIFRMVQRFWQHLPEEMRQGHAKRSVANVGRMYFPVLDSEFRVVSAADENAGRGLTIHNLHCSEVSRWPGDAQATLAGLKAALAPGGEMVMESTPNGAYGGFYEEWMRAGEPDSKVVRHFLPWWLEPAYRAEAATDLTEHESQLVAAHGLTPEQIGYRRGLETSYRRLRSQEFAEDAATCFRATGECCFDVDSIEARMAALGTPTTSRHGGALLIWLPPVAGREYLLGVDTAGGGSEGDFAAVQVIERSTGLQCAELQQRLGALELARITVALAKEYNGAMIAVERNNHGAAVLAYIDSRERYEHVYERDGVAGWLTTSASKPRMVSCMGTLLLEESSLFLSRRLLSECRSFVAFANGRTGAASGTHDDCLMAMALAQTVRQELQERPARPGAVSC